MKRVVAREQQIVGTYDDETLFALLNGGTLRLADLYWDTKTSTWRPLTDFIGHRAPVRRLVPALMRIAMLLTVAGCGSLVTWLAIRGESKSTAELQTAPAPKTVQLPAPPTPAPTLAPPPAGKKETQTAPKPGSRTALALLNVEVFDEEVAVTVQNSGPDAVNGFDLRLKCFVLPGDQLVFDSNEKAIAKQDAERLSGTAKAKELDAIIEALGRNLKIVSADVITWTPSHIKALPSAEQWKAFGDSELGDAGAVLSSTAAGFARGVESDDPVIRESALTKLLPDLGHRAGELKPLLERAIQRATIARNRLTTEQSVAQESLDRIRRQQEELRPRLAGLMAEARKNAIRTEIIHIDAVIEPDLVQRLTIKRQKNDRHGVSVELVRPDEKAVALSGPP